MYKIYRVLFFSVVIYIDRANDAKVQTRKRERDKLLYKSVFWKGKLQRVLLAPNGQGCKF